MRCCFAVLRGDAISFGIGILCNILATTGLTRTVRHAGKIRHVCMLIEQFFCAGFLLEGSITLCPNFQPGPMRSLFSVLDRLEREDQLSSNAARMTLSRVPAL